MFDKIIDKIVTTIENLNSEQKTALVCIGLFVAVVFLACMASPPLLTDTYHQDIQYRSNVPSGPKRLDSYGGYELLDNGEVRQVPVPPYRGY